SLQNQLGPDPDGPRYSDDVIMMPLQCATQWDSLAHVHYGGQLYNGHAASTLTSAGAARNGIDKMAAGHGLRGGLLGGCRGRGRGGGGGGGGGGAGARARERARRARSGGACAGGA